MIETSREIFIDSKEEAIVNTVNTVGVMGKGVALLIKEKFKENYRQYRAACKRNDIEVGRMFVVRTEASQRKLLDSTSEKNESENPQWIINFPTKKHWRNPSQLVWIEDGLKDLKRVIDENGIQTVAMPQLGCGNGGLDWKDVKPLVDEVFGNDLGVTIIVYDPPGK